MLKTKRVSEVINMPVYNDNGEYFGDVEETLIASNKIYGWKIRSTKKSYISKVMSGAKGVIIPHKLVKSIGDIMIVTKAEIPSYDERGTEITAE